MGNSAIFLDRDGVLNEDPGFLHEIAKLRFYPGIIDSLMKLAESQFKIIIITNQPGIGRGFFSESEYKKFEKKYLERLNEESKGRIRIDGIYHCPHHPEKGIGEYKVKCTCRKPEPGMLLDAGKDYDVDFGTSYMVGDKRSDIQAGVSAGCKTILVKTGCGGEGGTGCDVVPDYIISDLNEIFSIINFKG